MPRYGDSDYDSDFDDSPPPSATRKAFQPIPRPSSIRLLLRRLWRFRTIIITFCLLSGVLYFWTGIRRPSSRRTHDPGFDLKNLDWRYYAYSQYATDSAHLCNALMIFDTLDRLGSKAQRLLIYPDTMDTEINDSRDRDSQLLQLASQKYNVKLIPTKLEAVIKAGPHRATLSNTHKDQIGWDRSMTKLLVFNQTQYLRVIHVDNDITLYKGLDDLFLLPSAPIAMTRAYWNDQRPIVAPEGVEPEPQMQQNLSLPLSPHLIVIQPSALEAARVWQEARKYQESPIGTSVDALVLNKLYKDTALILPHRSLALQTGELRRSADDHEKYLGISSQPVNDESNSALSSEKWSGERIVREARLIHFSGDEPLPKPWIMWPKKLLKLIRPQCEYLDSTAMESGCQERQLWIDVYEDFRKRRKQVCALLSIPAPYWQATESHVSQ